MTGSEAGQSGNTADLPGPDTLRLDRDIAGSPGQVFAAWTAPATMRQWLFAGTNSEIVRISADLRAGGRFSILERPHDGSADIDHVGEYLEVDPPGRLAFTLEAPAHFAGRTRLDITITPTGTGSHLGFTQTGIDPAVVAGAWLRMFADLHELLSRDPR